MEDHTRRCGVCKQSLPYSEFPLKKDNTHDSYCRNCKKQYQKRHYANNPNYYKDRAARSKEWIREYLREIKATTPCADCHRIFHYCAMDFDHRQGETKLFNLSSGTRRGIEAVKREVAKCDVVCAICHRMRTYQRTHFSANIPTDVHIYRKRRAQLKVQQIDQILILHATGRFTHRQIAVRFGVDPSTITNIVTGKTWRERYEVMYQLVTRSEEGFGAISETELKDCTGKD